MSATVAGYPVEFWEAYLDAFAQTTRVGELRGVTVDTDRRGQSVARADVLYPNHDIWLGINPDGTRVTIAQYRAARGM